MNHVTRLRIPVGGNDHSQGPADAPVVLVEYGDYQCPHCGRAYWVVKRLQRALDGELRFVFRNFPVTEIHSEALNASCAAEAAAVQDSFWRMHDSLFEHQDRLDEENLFAYASALHLDVRKFARDMRSRKVEEKVERDFEGGVRSGVNGTPTFFINGARYDGDWSYEPFLHALMSIRSLAR
jgi:protein-disulfide isomerase